MRSVLITGGTGSFGRAFAKASLEDYERVCILSRDEHKQAVMREELGDHPALRFFIGDVRDYSRILRAMRDVDHVVHAAALKRIEVGHYCPDEMVKTNVLGTMNVIQAADDAGVKKMVTLSTDKACQPISAYGHSKAMAECLTLAANNTTGRFGTRYAVTRYGNVAGSAGSVIPKWRELKARGEGVKMTDPACTRFWMTMDEAVSLVHNTLDTMTGGELNIPELPAYKVADLAVAMDCWGTSTGLPPWEKMHECMRDGESSEIARRMTIDVLREAL
jgi:FlaA1/EpsC-like NDP-sugar epimerase